MLLRAWTLILCTATAVMLLFCGINWFVGTSNTPQLHPLIAFPLMAAMLLIPHLMLLKEAKDLGINVMDYLEFLSDFKHYIVYLENEPETSCFWYAGSGWYFWDECGLGSGPFKTKRLAEYAFIRYVQWLNEGGRDD